MESNNSDVFVRWYQTEIMTRRRQKHIKHSLEQTASLWTLILTRPRVITRAKWSGIVCLRGLDPGIWREGVKILILRERNDKDGSRDSKCNCLRWLPKLPNSSTVCTAL